MFKGEQVYLRLVELSDASTILLWENDTENWKVSETEVPFDLNSILTLIEQAQQIRTYGQLRFMICLNETNESIGTIDLFDANFKHKRAGVGVLIADKSNRNKGFAKEALLLLVKYANEILGLKNLYCTIHSNNELSVKLFESIGFNFVGARKDWYLEKGKWLDELMYQLCLEN